MWHSQAPDHQQASKKMLAQNHRDAACTCVGAVPDLGSRNVWGLQHLCSCRSPRTNPRGGKRHHVQHPQREHGLQEHSKRCSACGGKPAARHMEMQGLTRSFFPHSTEECGQYFPELCLHGGWRVAEQGKTYQQLHRHLCQHASEFRAVPSCFPFKMMWAFREKRSYTTNKVRSTLVLVHMHRSPAGWDFGAAYSGQGATSHFGASCGDGDNVPVAGQEAAQHFLPRRRHGELSGRTMAPSSCSRQATLGDARACEIPSAVPALVARLAASPATHLGC